MSRERVKQILLLTLVPLAAWVVLVGLLARQTAVDRSWIIGLCLPTSSLLVHNDDGYNVMYCFGDNNCTMVFDDWVLDSTMASQLLFDDFDNVTPSTTPSPTPSSPSPTPETTPSPTPSPDPFTLQCATNSMLLHGLRLSKPVVPSQTANNLLAGMIVCLLLWLAPVSVIVFAIVYSCCCKPRPQWADPLAARTGGNNYIAPR